MPLFPSTTAIESTLDIYTDDTPYLALYTSNPTAGDSGTEVTGGSYARQPITFGSTSGGARSNTVAVNFAGLPTTNITHYGIRNALSGGDLLAFGALNSAVASVTGDQVTFAIGAIQVSLAGS
jgi:hypothetical protein